MNELDPSRQSKLNKLGGRKFGYLLALTAVLAGFIILVVFCKPDRIVVDALEHFFSVYALIAVAVVGGNVVEKLPIGKGK